MLMKVPTRGHKKTAQNSIHESTTKSRSTQKLDPKTRFKPKSIKYRDIFLTCTIYKIFNNVSSNPQI